MTTPLSLVPRSLFQVLPSVEGDQPPLCAGWVKLSIASWAGMAARVSRPAETLPPDGAATPLSKFALYPTAAPVKTTV